MRALVVYCHPREESFSAAVRDTVMAGLKEAGVQTRLLDLYREGFDPVLSPAAHRDYLDENLNRTGIEAHIEALQWCDTLIFVYPTWWYGLPAMLKGWLDRVLVPGVAFAMPQAEGENIAANLTHITRLGVFTTCGASWWLTRMIGAPGRRTLLRGVRLLCARRCRTAFAAHYLMDTAERDSLERHLGRVRRNVDKLIGPVPQQKEAVA